MNVHSIRAGLAAALVACATSATPQSFDEYEVKAGYLLNFAKYVEWPPTAFASADAPLVLCVVGDDPFGARLDLSVRGRSANGRTIVIRRVGVGEPVGTCHLAFLAGERDRGDIRVPREMEDGPTLLVSDRSEFLAQGGAIALSLERQRVRFAIDVRAAERRRLRVSAKLLQVAQHVVGVDAPRGSKP